MCQDLSHYISVGVMYIGLGPLLVHPLNYLILGSHTLTCVYLAFQNYLQGVAKELVIVELDATPS